MYIYICIYICIIYVCHYIIYIYMPCLTGLLGWPSKEQL